MVKSNTVTLSKDVDARFRICISKRHPQERGARKISGDEAVTMWNEWVDAIPDKAAMKVWADKWMNLINP